MSNLRTFRDQMLCALELSHNADSPNRIFRGIHIMGEHVDHQGVGFREFRFLRHVPGTRYNLSPLNQEQWSDRYILDWYYISWREGTSTTRAPVDIESGRLPSLAPQPGDYGRPPSLFRIAEERNNDETWEDQQYDSRSFSHMGASTSAPPFRGSVFRQHESGSRLARSHTKSHWWARSGPHGDNTLVQTSFMEPPDFDHHPWNNDDYPDDNSERGVDEDEVLDWRIHRPLDRTTFMDGTEEAGDVSLHFDDVYYSRPS